MGLPQVLGCRARRVFSRLYFELSERDFELGERVAWILRSVQSVRGRRRMSWSAALGLTLDDAVAVAGRHLRGLARSEDCLFVSAGSCAAAMLSLCSAAGSGAEKRDRAGCHGRSDTSPEAPVSRQAKMPDAGGFAFRATPCQLGETPRPLDGFATARTSASRPADTDRRAPDDRGRTCPSVDPGQWEGESVRATVTVAPRASRPSGRWRASPDRIPAQPVPANRASNGSARTPTRQLRMRRYSEPMPCHSSRYSG